MREGGGKSRERMSGRAGDMVATTHMAMADMMAAKDTGAMIGEGTRCALEGVGCCKM